MAKRTQKQDVSSKNMITIALIVAAAFLISGNGLTGAYSWGDIASTFSKQPYIPPQPVAPQPVITSNGNIQEPIIITEPEPIIPIEPTAPETEVSSGTYSYGGTWTDTTYGDGTRVREDTFPPPEPGKITLISRTTTFRTDGTITVVQTQSDGTKSTIIYYPFGSNVVSEMTSVFSDGMISIHTRYADGSVTETLKFKDGTIRTTTTKAGKTTQY